MSRVRVLALVGILLAGLLAGAPAGAAGTLHTFLAATADSPAHLVGTTLTLNGYVCLDCSTGNTGTLDFSFRKLGGTAYAKAGSTTVTAAGEFSLDVPLTGSGTYQAVYHGNASAKPVTLTASEISYAIKTVTVTVFSHSMASCTSPCSYVGGTVPVNPGPLLVTARHTCDDGLTVSYGTSSHAFPAPQATFDLAPATGLGHFSVKAAGGCGWSVTATQTHTRLVQA